MKTAVTLSLALIAGLAFAQDNAAASQQPKTEKGPSILVRMGGRHIRPGSQKGKIAVIDTQTKVAGDAFKEVVAMMAKETKLNVVYEKAEKGEVAALKANSKADVAVVIVDDAATPSLLVAPEDLWAVMNVAKMDKNLNSDAAKAKFYVPRCARELMRALSLVCGGGSSDYPRNVMNYAKQEDVDLAIENAIPVDRRDAYLQYLAPIGVTPAKWVPYETACREGWAPKPTDKYQQEIWDEVRAIPEKPIKIKFDPKRDK